MIHLCNTFNLFIDNILVLIVHVCFSFYNCFYSYIILSSLQFIIFIFAVLFLAFNHLLFYYWVMFLPFISVLMDSFYVAWFLHCLGSYDIWKGPNLLTFLLHVFCVFSACCVFIRTFELSFLFFVSFFVLCQSTLETAVLKSAILIKLLLLRYYSNRQNHHVAWPQR